MRAHRSCKHTTQQLAKLAPLGEPLAKVPTTLHQCRQARQREALRRIGVYPSQLQAVLDAFPQLCELSYERLQHRAHALAAAFGGLPYGAFKRRINAAPELLTMPHESIRPAIARLLEFGLTQGEAAAAVAEQPGILLLTTSQLRESVASLASSFELSPGEVHYVISYMSQCLRLVVVPHEANGPQMAHLCSIAEASKRNVGAGKRLRNGKPGFATF